LLFPLNTYAGDLGGIERYAGDTHFHGAVNWRVGTTTVPMAIQHEADYRAYRALHDTADYDDVASDLDIEFGCQSALLLDRHNLLGIALLRGRRDGPCGAETLSNFAFLRTQLARAIRLQLALDGEAAELMLGDMAALHSATILLDRHGAVAALSPAAEPLFDDSGPFRLDAMAPQLRAPAADARFQLALGRVFRYGADTVETVEAGGWTIAIVALPARAHGLGFDPYVAITARPARAAASATASPR
jgi:hypothetical protein